MRKLLGISVVVQAIVFLGVLVALFQYGESDSLPGWIKQASNVVYLLVCGLVLSVGAAGALFSKMEIKNDGRLSFLIAQLSLVSLVIIHGAFVLLVVLLPGFFAFKYWRDVV